MKTVTLDIETDTEGWEVDGEVRDKCPPLTFHVPTVICVSIKNGKSHKDKVYRWENPVEELQQLSSVLQWADRCITWNGRAFDLPLLQLHAMKNSVDWTWFKDCAHRYPNYKTGLWCWDMMDLLANFGAARNLSLDNTAKFLGLGGKEGNHEMTGEDLVKYCNRDVELTYEIYLKYVGGEA